jgi:uncharacterized protein
VTDDEVQGPAPSDEPAPPPWGLRPVIVGLLVGLAGSIVLGGLWIALSGDEGLGLAAVSLVGLWIGTGGTPLWLSRTRGSGSLARDFGLRFAPVDVPVGIASGVAVQILLVPLIYLPLEQLFPRVARELSQPARELAAQARSGVAFAVLALLVVIGAPVVEELFFRGLLQGVVSRRRGPVVAIVSSAVAFGLAHFQVVQLPALVALGLVLGWLFHRRGRLGPSIVAHSAFNAMTMAFLWAAR